MAPLLPRLLLLTLLPYLATPLTCPSYTSRHGTTTGPLDLSTSTTLTLTNTPSPGTLCTLYTISTSTGHYPQSYYIPLGRSYDGHNWERVAGKYNTLSYTCSSGECVVTLPEDLSSADVYLTSYLYTLTASQTSARFFERASFGATPSMLTLATDESSMANWISDQLDESKTPLSSHREYFRKRLNPRMVQLGKFGRDGPRVCEVNSRWRGFAFTKKDYIISSSIYDNYWPIAQHNATLETKTVSSTTKYIWRFAGHIRTMLSSPPQLSEDDSTIPDGDYIVCGVDNLPGSVYSTQDEQELYAKFQIVIDDTCKHVKGGNPDVFIDPSFLSDEITPGGHVVDFTSVPSQELVAIGTQFPDTVRLLTKTDYYDSHQGECDAFPDPEKTDYRNTGWLYSPYYEGRKHPNWRNKTAMFIDEPIYAKMPDNTYYLHDRRYTPVENTPTNPLSDGGGTMTMESIYRDINSYEVTDGKLLPVDVDDNPRTKSSLSGNEQAIYCSNSQPNIFNENNCKLSTDPNACVRMSADDEDTVVVVKLTPLALSKINGYANTTLFQVNGLEFTSATELPCTMGSLSRWVVQDGVSTKGDCDALGSVTVEAETYSAFTDLLYYSVSNNVMLRDVTMHEKFQGSGCHANDANKYGFSIFDYSSSTCFLNEHPENLDVFYVQDDNISALGVSGTISWISSGLTMDDWDDFMSNRTLYDYYGRTGDLLKLEDMMESLGVYKLYGGKDVTSAPTTSPSEMPSYGPSASLVPNIIPSELPSAMPSDKPSLSTAPSDSPSSTNPPSLTQHPSSSPSTEFPSESPSLSLKPSSTPSSQPSTSAEPSSTPSDPQHPSDSPSNVPSLSLSPSSSPSESLEPSNSPSSQPSSIPSASAAPSSVPSMTAVPSMEPTQISHVARTINDMAFFDVANDPDVAYVILKSEFAGLTGGVLVCGSEGEIAPDPTEDDYFDYWTRRMDDTTPVEGEQKKTVWTNIALEGIDQLAQRIAFALSQIFAISPSFLGYPRLSEAYTYFYDLFVLHGTTTYREVLKNIAYSVKMGMQLSHAGSKSLRYYYDGRNKVRFPDENYAREVMQLETIGLEMLNMDGTVIRDSRGDVIPTYDTEDILTFARAWTGFDMPIRRGNYEEKDALTISWMDPMTLDGRGRDWFPKRDLLDGWIGDRYPLCSDLPVRHFLKTGATFKLLGKSSQPRYSFNDPAWEGEESINRMTLDPNSALLSLLCAESGGSCTYPASVTLQSDIECSGFECDLATMQVFQVAPNVFYEYVRRPCVHFAFLDDAKTVYAGWRADSIGRMCASPSQPVATTTCCFNGIGSPELFCVYTGEFVDYQTNFDRCGGDESHICHNAVDTVDKCGECCDQIRSYKKDNPEYNYWQWSKGGCNYQVKINLDGTVAMIHVPEENLRVAQMVGNSIKNMNYFAVPWPVDPFLGDRLYPSIENGCGNGTCIEQSDWTCLCNVTVSNSMAFTSDPADANAIRETLKIGAFEPSYFDAGIYASPVTLSTDSSVSVYHLSNVNDYSEDTIFMLLDEFGGETIYLKNLASTITIGDDVNDYYTEPLRRPLVMRNPLSFFDVVKPETRDAYYETEAVIDHYMHHPNAAPFVSMQLIQHIAGISNPSPSYVERVSTAFATGTFVSNGITFGTGKLSDMKAVVAAILLDQEATSSTLDADPTHGGIKEPIIKVMQYLRSMEYTKNDWYRHVHPQLSNMVAKVGQMVHESPDQFSFFLLDYSPPGQMNQASLFAPAGQVLTLSTTISTVEGLFSLVRQGLSAFQGGFGTYNFGYSGSLVAGDYSRSVGYLSFSPTGSTTTEKVQEIADLLTSGRLSPEAITAIATTVDQEANLETKIRLAQQIIATSPEYHTTNLASRNGNTREPTPIQERSADPYKAVVVLHLSGGLDSFNVLMPHGSCPNYQYYRNGREALAIKDTAMLTITNPNTEAYSCNKMGIHPSIPILKEIYDDGKGIFMANIGHLHKPVTKNNWFTETKTHLFSHKTMEREAQLVDAFQEDGWSTGVLGRMLDKLQLDHGMSVSANGIDGKGFIIEGNPATGRTVDVIPSSGVNVLTRQSLESQDNDVEGILKMMEFMNEEFDISTSGIFAQFWAQNLIDTINKTDYLSNLLSTTTLMNQDLFTGSVGRKLDIISRMIMKNEDRNVNRDAFFITMGGYDGHALSNDNLEGNLPVVERGLRAFYKEMTDQGFLNNVTFVLMSEFGRTTSPNSGLGSDHAWGGNAFVFGGEIKGGTLLGSYPERLDEKDMQNVGRGRLIPAISWESMWYGITNWFGITDGKEIEYVLPNNGNMGCQLYPDSVMYTTGNNTISGCNDRMVEMKLSMFLNEPRYLTGMEQKKICKAAIAKVAKRANVTSRCIVVDQKVVVSVDFNRRRTLSGLDGLRYLQAANDTNATYEVEAEVALDYDDTVNKTGAQYIEDVTSFTADMNEELTGNCTGTCEFKIDNVAAVLAFEAQVTDAPSMSPSVSLAPSDRPSNVPSNIPSESPSKSSMPSESPSISTQPSSQPSTAPSKSAQPSETPSISSQPSSQPSSEPSKSPHESPSSSPSSQPSESPSAIPSISTKPSTSPSDSPSFSPSDKPSASPSDDPSLHPSQSPSGKPSSSPSESPSDIPSSSPSRSPSGSPSDNPSFLPSNDKKPSGSPSEAPSSMPSIAPSAFPSRDCPEIPDNCGTGMWSPYICECLCIRPHCPGDDGLSCSSSSTSCTNDYYRNVFRDCTYDCPWFKHGDACMRGENVPAGTKQIHRSKDACCQSEFPNDIAGCDERTGGFYQLHYNARFTMTGTDCSTPSSDLALAASDIAKSTIASLCTKIPGLRCDPGDKVIVNKFCGQNVEHEVDYQSSSLFRFLTSSDEIVEYTILLYGIAESDIRQKDSLLSQYLQGASLNAILADILNQITTNGSTQSLQSVSAIYYAFMNSFIQGLGLYYPAWGSAETCLNDGNQPEYMNVQPELWLTSTLDECCKQYYGWNEAGCKLENTEASLLSGSGSASFADPTADLYYPDWGHTNTCVANGQAPPYMKKQSDIWMYATLDACCKAYYSWEDDYIACLGGSNSATVAPSEGWYVKWDSYTCVKNCEGASPCGGIRKQWNVLHDTKKKCCDEHLWWAGNDCSA